MTRQAAIDSAIRSAKDMALQSNADAWFRICAGGARCPWSVVERITQQPLGCAWCSVYTVQPSGLVSVKEPGNA